MYKTSLQFIFLFCAVFLCSFSCQDHNVEPKRLAVIVSEPFKYSSQPVSMTFNLRFTDLGNVAITEYGIIYARGGKDLTDVNSDGVIFEKFTATPEVSKLITQVHSNINNQGIRLYRAYAKLSDGTIVYGKLIEEA